MGCRKSMQRPTLLLANAYLGVRATWEFLGLPAVCCSNHFGLVSIPVTMGFAKQTRKGTSRTKSSYPSNLSHLKATPEIPEHSFQQGEVVVSNIFIFNMFQPYLVMIILLANISGIGVNHPPTHPPDAHGACFCDLHLGIESSFVHTVPKQSWLLSL